MPLSSAATVKSRLNSGFPRAQQVALCAAYPPTIRADLRTQQSYATDAVVGDISDLTLTVDPGKRYAIRAVMHCTASAAGGIQFDLGGGSATMTSIGGNGVCNSAAASVTVAVTALTTAVTQAAVATLQVEVNVTVVVNVGGTIVVRGAQHTSNAGASTANVGSFIDATELPD